MKEIEKYYKVGLELDKILQKGDITLIDEFEEVFSKLEFKKETSAMIVYGNRQLIRSAYRLIVALKGKYANFADLHKLITNYNGMGRKIISEASKITSVTSGEIDLGEDSSWFLCEYYNMKGNCHLYCLPTRYNLGKIISIFEYMNYEYLREEPIEKESSSKNSVSAQDVLCNFVVTSKEGEREISNLKLEDPDYEDLI